MHLESAAMTVAPDVATTAPKSGESPQDGATVADVFAALLAALTPAAPIDPGVNGEAGAEGEAGAKGETVADGEGSAEGAGSGQSGAGPSGANLSQLALAMEGTEPFVLSGAVQAGGPIVVPRGQGGLPLVAAPEVATPDASAAPATMNGHPQPAATAPTALPGANAEPAPLGLPAGLAQPVDADGGETVHHHKNAAATTPVATDPEVASPEGRPVRTVPAPSIAATYKPVVEPGGEDEPESAADGDESTPRLDATGPRPGDGAAASTPAAAPDVATPEPRPSNWPPGVEAASGGATDTAAATATAAGGPETTPTPVSHHAQAAPDVAAGRPPVDPQKIQAQVLRQILGRAEQNDGSPQEIKLQLDPEHLGKVEVRLTSRGNQLQIEFQAESTEAGAALREGRQELVRSLTTQASRWHQVEIKVAEPGGASTRTDEQNDERSEHGGRRERDQQQRRRHRDER